MSNKSFYQGMAPCLLLMTMLYISSILQCIYYAWILDNGPRVCVIDPKGINEWWCRSGEDALLLFDEAARTAHRSVPRHFYTKYNVITWNSKLDNARTREWAVFFLLSLFLRCTKSEICLENPLNSRQWSQLQFWMVALASRLSQCPPL